MARLMYNKDQTPIPSRPQFPRFEAANIPRLSGDGGEADGQRITADILRPHCRCKCAHCAQNAQTSICSSYGPLDSVEKSERPHRSRSCLVCAFARAPHWLVNALLGLEMAIRRAAEHARRAPLNPMLDELAASPNERTRTAMGSDLYYTLNDRSEIAVLRRLGHLAAGRKLERPTWSGRGIATSCPNRSPDHPIANHPILLVGGRGIEPLTTCV
jgi:hypothetical protein